MVEPVIENYVYAVVQPLAQIYLRIAQQCVRVGRKDPLMIAKIFGDTPMASCEEMSVVDVDLMFKEEGNVFLQAITGDHREQITILCDGIRSCYNHPSNEWERSDIDRIIKWWDYIESGTVLCVSAKLALAVDSDVRQNRVGYDLSVVCASSWG